MRSHVSQLLLAAFLLLLAPACGEVDGGGDGASSLIETGADTRPARNPCDKLGEPVGSLKILPHATWPAGLRGRHLRICFDKAAAGPPTVTVTPTVYNVVYSCQRIPGFMDCVLPQDQIPLLPETNYQITVTAADRTVEKIWMGDHPNSLRPGELVSATVCEHLEVEARHWGSVDCYERATNTHITGVPFASVGECVTDDDARLHIRSLAGTDDLGIYRVYTSTAFIPSLQHDMVLANRIGGDRAECQFSSP